MENLPTPINHLAKGISVIVPVFNSESSVKELNNRIISVINNEGYSDFSYYPNPIDSYLNINNQSKNESIIIFDINSKSIFKSELIIGNNILDVSGLQSGIYSVKIGLKTFKILKK